MVRTTSTTLRGKPFSLPTSLIFSGLGHLPSAGRILELVLKKVASLVLQGCKRYGNRRQVKEQVSLASKESSWINFEIRFGTPKHAF